MTSGGSHRIANGTHFYSLDPPPYTNISPGILGSRLFVTLVISPSASQTPGGQWRQLLRAARGEITLVCYLLWTGEGRVRQSDVLSDTLLLPWGQGLCWQLWASEGTISTVLPASQTWPWHLLPNHSAVQQRLAGWPQNESGVESAENLLPPSFHVCMRGVCSAEYDKWIKGKSSSEDLF